MASSLDRLVAQIRACRLCVEAPSGVPLPHEPRPVLRVSRSARIAIAGQAPGTRVHASGLPFSDPSGVRLRDWMGLTSEEFYDERRVAVVPMGFCFPGQDRAGADLPPRKECAPRWRARLLAELPQIELMLLVGGYAHRWHLGEGARNVSDTVASWQAILKQQRGPRYFPLPHPSWRNNAWLKSNDWFEKELVPVLRREIRKLL
jgi:uracil-DNA glycosylase